MAIIVWGKHKEVGSRGKVIGTCVWGDNRNTTAKVLDPERPWSYRSLGLICPGIKKKVIISFTFILFLNQCVLMLYCLIPRGFQCNATDSCPTSLQSPETVGVNFKFILAFIFLILKNKLILTYLDVTTKIFSLMSEKKLAERGEGRKEEKERGRER